MIPKKFDFAELQKRFQSKAVLAGNDLNSGTTTFISDPAWNYRGLALSNNGLALVERDPSLVQEPSSLIFLALGLVGIVGVTARGYRSRFLGHARGIGRPQVLPRPAAQ